MTITINFNQRPMPGYVPSKPVTLHNVESVHDKGISAIEVRNMFTDHRPTYDHVASVNIRPEQGE